MNIDYLKEKYCCNCRLKFSEIECKISKGKLRRLLCPKCSTPVRLGPTNSRLVVR